MEMPNNKTLLIIVAVLLLGVMGFFALDNSREKTLTQTIEEAVEEVEDEIDDNTTSR